MALESLLTLLALAVSAALAPAATAAPAAPAGPAPAAAEPALSRAKDYPPTECDRLAANPEDQDIIAPPVPRVEVDLPRAIAACEAAIAKHPDNARARYQLSRVLAYNGQHDRANVEMQRAADQGYRQAQFVLGLVIDRGRPGTRGDPCMVEQYWLASARLGRQAARVSYVRHALDGKFDTCPVNASREEMRRFLESAVQDASNYYEKLLIEDLATELRATTPRAAAPREAARAGVLVTRCDRLASHPEDPDAVALGVERRDIDLPKTIEACREDVERYPGNARVRYEYARVLAYDGQTKLATEEMRRSADAGHRQAQFVFGLFVDRNRADAPRDACLVEEYWLKSAKLGRQAARLSYVKHALDGKFESCSHRSTPADLRNLLDAATGEASGFYERLLIDDLADRLAARSRS